MRCGVQLLGAQLSRVMLLAIEVAVEYWLALTWSPQAQWLTDIAKTGIIQDEVCGASLHLLLSGICDACMILPRFSVIPPLVERCVMPACLPKGSPDVLFTAALSSLEPTAKDALHVGR